MEFVNEKKFEKLDNFIVEFNENDQTSPIDLNELSEVVDIINAMPEKRTDVVFVGNLNPTDDKQSEEYYDTLIGMDIELTDDEKNIHNTIKLGQTK